MSDDWVSPIGRTTEGVMAEPFSAGVVEARELEDRPRDDQLVEDSHRIAELLGEP